jgi:chitin synthase
MDQLHSSPLILLGENGKLLVWVTELSTVGPQCSLTTLTVLNVSLYINTGIMFYGIHTHNAIIQSLGNDMSLALSNWDDAKQAQNCLLARYRVGVIQTETGGCIASSLVMDIMLSIIITLIVVRYSMAIVFRWCIAGNLVKPGGRAGTFSWRSRRSNDSSNWQTQSNRYSSPSRSSVSRAPTPPPKVEITDDLYTVMLVTCYSEGVASLKSTMDSLAETHYSKQHKLLVVIADGLITGSGETQSTPDMVLSMLELDPASTAPKPCFYQAIADGEKQLNRAKVASICYSGSPPPK